MLIGQFRDIYFKTQSLISSIFFFTYNKDSKFAKLPQMCSEKWPQIRLIVWHLQHQNIIYLLAWMNSKLHYKKLKRQQFNNSWKIPLQSGVEQREVLFMSSIRRIICEDSQTQSCRSTFNGFCKGSSRTIFRRFGDGSGSKSASLLSVSLPEDSDDLSKQKSIFLLASVSLTFVDVWYIVLPGEIYFTASWWSYDVTSVVHCAGSEKSIQDPVPRPLASAPFIPLSWYNFFFSDFESFFFLSCDAIVNKGVLQFDQLCALR